MRWCNTEEKTKKKEKEKEQKEKKARNRQINEQCDVGRKEQGS